MISKSLFDINRLPTSTINSRNPVTMDATEYIFSLNPSLYLPLGETTGLARDISGNGNHGTIVLGSGERNTEPLNGEDGDGSLTFATDTTLTVPDSLTIRDIFNGGGSLLYITKQTSLSTGIGWSKRASGTTAGWTLNPQSNGALIFWQIFSSNRGQWSTGMGAVRENEDNVILLNYDCSDVANDPVVYVHNPTNGLQIYDSMSLTEQQTPVGTFVSDNGLPFGVNNVASQYSGIMDECVIWKGKQMTQEQLEEFISLFS